MSQRGLARRRCHQHQVLDSAKEPLFFAGQGIKFVGGEGLGTRDFLKEQTRQQCHLEGRLSTGQSEKYQLNQLAEHRRLHLGM